VGPGGEATFECFLKRIVQREARSKLKGLPRRNCAPGGKETTKHPPPRPRGSFAEKCKEF